MKTFLFSLSLVAVLTAQLQATDKTGGANSPEPGPPQKLILDPAELAADGFRVKVPVGKYTAPAGGAPNYSVPGPIIAFKGPDGIWRGHGYLETYRRLTGFEGRVEAGRGSLRYTFEDDKQYLVTIEARHGAILLEEQCHLGPRNLWVFDCFYGDWLPTAGFALDRNGRNPNFLYLPCFYDKPDVTVRPADEKSPGGIGVVSNDPAKKDIAAFWGTQFPRWQNADTLGLQLWQHRQLPGDPSSRHFLGPETKSDSTPNPRTAALLRRSLYEGHVTVELSLGTGTRWLAFGVAGKGATRTGMLDDLQKILDANR